MTSFAKCVILHAFTSTEFLNSHKESKYESKKVRRSTAINELWCWRKLSPCMWNRLILCLQLSCLFESENGGSSSLWNICKIYQTIHSVISETVLPTRRSHCHGNFRPHIILTLSWSTLYVISWQRIFFGNYILIQMHEKSPSLQLYRSVSHRVLSQAISIQIASSQANSASHKIIYLLPPYRFQGIASAATDGFRTSQDLIPTPIPLR
jgi:hypothetical protein